MSGGIAEDAVNRQGSKITPTGRAVASKASSAGDWTGGRAIGPFEVAETTALAPTSMPAMPAAAARLARPGDQDVNRVATHQAAAPAISQSSTRNIGGPSAARSAVNDGSSRTSVSEGERNSSSAELPSRTF